MLYRGKDINKAVQLDITKALSMLSTITYFESLYFVEISLYLCQSAMHCRHLERITLKPVLVTVLCMQ